jgi:REP element-mobilizing transposase RayT
MARQRNTDLRALPPAQQVLPLPRAKDGWGGRRAGAGRPRAPHPKALPHRPRRFHDARQPVHVTLRVRRHLGSLRRRDVAAAILDGFRAAAADTARTRTFRVVHFSIQPDHLHLVVEATSKVALGRGLQGLVSRLARRINRRLGRRGHVFADRYFGRSLATPAEVRNAIAYVLTNAAKHAEPIPDLGTAPVRGLDPCSSGCWFDGWDLPPPAQRLAAPVAPAETWLLRIGWRRHGGGVILRTSVPAAVRPSPPPRT